MRLEESPFHVVTQTKAWHRPKDTTGRDVPLRAGVSSFGFGGANAHVIIEEYRADERVAPKQIPAAPAGPQLFVLSAKTKEALLHYARNVRDHLSHRLDQQSTSFEDVAYTLQVGRPELQYRLAVIATSFQELMTAIDAYLASDSHFTEESNILIFEVQNHKVMAFIEPETYRPQTTAFNQTKLSQAELQVMAQHWVDGGKVNWSTLYASNPQTDENRRRIPLPTYPFERIRHWFEAK